MDRFGPWHEDLCRSCGTCLRECPVLHLAEAEAIEEIGRLRRGGPARALRACESCLGCNAWCPNGANPGRLVLDRWAAGHRREGLPARARWFSPADPPNFRTWVLDRLPAEERARVASWADESPCEEVLYPGCNWITAPWLARSALLGDLPIRGSLAVCCGEMYFRMGLFDRAVEAGRRTLGWLASLGARRVVMACPAGLNMFTHILPSFGVEPPFEVVSLLSWLLARIEAGRVSLRPVHLRVTVQDSCSGRHFGPEYLELPRRLLRLAGAEVVEQEPHGDHALCCGIGAGFGHDAAYHPAPIAVATRRSLTLARRTGAEAIATYCAGCMQTLIAGQVLDPTRQMPVLHVLEVLGMAVGEEPMPMAEKRRRARVTLAGVARNQVPLLLSRRRIRL